MTVSGVAKGVGMIHPNMATMLSFVLTDADAEPETLSRLLRPIVARTWNQTSVDGDQSTNDTVLLVASGASGAAPVEDDPQALATLGAGRRGRGSLAGASAGRRRRGRDHAHHLRRQRRRRRCRGPRRGAGGRRRATCSRPRSTAPTPTGAASPWPWATPSSRRAETLEAAGLAPDAARARAGQPVELDPDRLQIDIEGTPVFAGLPLEYDEAALSERMKGGEVIIRVDLGLGSGTGEAFGCDLTEEYVIENSEYST